VAVDEPWAGGAGERTAGIVGGSGAAPQGGSGPTQDDGSPGAASAGQGRLALAEIPRPGYVAQPRWAAPLFLVAAALLVPWIVFLAVSLPRRSEAENYRLAWVGFDMAILGVLAALGWMAYRRSTWTELLAASAATLLVVDAWFDIVTASGTSDRTIAIASAALVELPLACLCGWLARNAERVRRHGVRKLGWQIAELEARLPHRRRQPTPDAGGSAASR
jgi:signal transduction histidine kinase